MKCEGSCDTQSTKGHSGAIQRVHITRTGGSVQDWGKYNYCQTAIEGDRKEGFKVEILNLPQPPEVPDDEEKP